MYLAINHTNFAINQLKVLKACQVKFSIFPPTRVAALTRLLNCRVNVVWCASWIFSVKPAVVNYTVLHITEQCVLKPESAVKPQSTNLSAHCTVLSIECKCTYYLTVAQQLRLMDLHWPPQSFMSVIHCIRKCIQHFLSIVFSTLTSDLQFSCLRVSSPVYRAFDTAVNVGDWLVWMSILTVGIDVTFLIVSGAGRLTLSAKKRVCRRNCCLFVCWHTPKSLFWQYSWLWWLIRELAVSFRNRAGWQTQLWNQGVGWARE